MLCAKSTWSPAIRREHALSHQAAANLRSVVFVERPTDIRSGCSPGSAWSWARGLRPRARSAVVEPGINVVSRSTAVPGHFSHSAQRVDEQLLSRVLRRVADPDSAVVCCVPWDWPAVAAGPARRRVFDMADDWGELMPGRRERFAALYRRIAAQADAVIVVNDDLRRHFPDREVHVLPNGVPSWMIGAPRVGPAPRSMLYVGTLSPRFDASLMGQVLDVLGDWSLQLVGPCLYPARGDRPDDELQTLLERDDVRWLGALPRADVPAHIDAASVLILPNRPSRSVGQDSMKLYDYAARGRPIVSTAWSSRLAAPGAPHVLVASTPAAFAAAIESAVDEPADRPSARRAWAAEQTWDARWPQWSRMVFGASG